MSIDNEDDDYLSGQLKKVVYIYFCKN